MEDLSLVTLNAIFQDMFGFWLWWLMVVVAAIVTILLFYIMFRDRRFKPRHFLLAQLTSPFGAVAAVFFVMWQTNSDFSDIGGPIDVIVLLIIAAIGAVGTVILAYVGQSIWARRKQKKAEAADQA